MYIIVNSHHFAGNNHYASHPTIAAGCPPAAPLLPNDGGGIVHLGVLQGSHPRRLAASLLYIFIVDIYRLLYTYIRYLVYRC